MKKRLSVLAVLVVCLFTVAATPLRKPTPGSWCERRVNDESCVIYCCTSLDCYEWPC